MGSNQINTIEPGAWRGLVSLKELWLQYNKLTALRPGVFVGLSALTYLDMHKNQISVVEPGAWKGLDSLEELKLHSNRLTKVEFASFSSLSHVLLIDMDNNAISTFEPGALNGSLETLRLEQNKLSLFPDMFVTLPNLKELALGDNGFTSLEPGVFNGLHQLNTLYLYQNGIKTLHPDVFNELWSLRTLWLWGNQLTSLEARVVRNQPRPLNLALSSETSSPGTPWDCDTLCWLRLEHQDHTITWRSDHKPVCAEASWDNHQCRDARRTSFLHDATTF